MRAELANSSARIGETGEPWGTPWSGLGANGPQKPSKETAIDRSEINEATHFCKGSGSRRRRRAARRWG